MSISARFTSKDLDWLPAVEGIRYEIVDGDLYVSKQPHCLPPLGPLGAVALS